MAPSVTRQQTADEFLAAAGEFLALREAEHNLLFGICSAIRLSSEAFGQDPPRFLTVTDAVGSWPRPVQRARGGALFQAALRVGYTVPVIAVQRPSATIDG